MRIIIAGSRNFYDYDLLQHTVTELIDKLYYEERIKMFGDMLTIEIVSGGATGADQLGEKYALAHDLDCKVMKADWNKWGKSAGYRRNVEMAEYAKQDDGVLIAFNKGTPGTQHMIDIAKKHKLEVYEIKV